MVCLDVLDLPMVGLQDFIEISIEEREGTVHKFGDVLADIFYRPSCLDLILEFKSEYSGFYLVSYEATEKVVPDIPLFGTFVDTVAHPRNNRSLPE